MLAEVASQAAATGSIVGRNVQPGQISTVAIDVWIELISTARADINILVATLREVMTAGDLPTTGILSCKA